MQVDKSPYAYTWNNPINLVDPDGMHPEMEEENWNNINEFDSAGNYTGGDSFDDPYGTGTDVSSNGFSMSPIDKVKAGRQILNDLTKDRRKVTGMYFGEGSFEYENENCCGSFTNALAFQEAMNPSYTNGRGSLNQQTKSFLGGAGRTFSIGSMTLAYNAKNFARSGQIVLEGIGRWHVFSKTSLEMTSRLSTYAKVFGRVAGGVSITYNIADYYSGKTSGYDLGVNTGFTAYGILGGPVGLFWSGTYFLFDITGGKAVMEARARRMHRDIRNGMSSHEAIEKYSCFVKGTKVLMANNSEKNIEDIALGDRIMSVNMETMQLEKDLVVEIPAADKKYRIIEAVFSNGIINKFSPAHPYWVKGKGWSVFDLEEAKTELKFGVHQLKIGDTVLYHDKGTLKETKILSLKDTGKYIEMYNVEFVKKNHNFFANGILVHNKRIN